MSTPIFTDWRPEHTQGWSRRPISLAHSLHTSNLFSDATLASLIDSYPREHYALIHMGARDERKTWREGDIGDHSGAEVIERIARGRMWLNLRNVSEVDPRYGAVVEQMFAEIRTRVPELETISFGMGILISSPLAQVYYHADLPGQALGQIRGRKRVYIYPPEPPFLTQEGLEGIALSGLEVGLAYDPAFDRQATVIDLEAGQLLHWPLNGPHRVENHDCLNISFTVEFQTPQIRRHMIVTSANGLLRQTIGVAPGGQTTDGASYWAKALLQAGARRSGLIKRRQRKRQPILFQLDRTAPDGIRDLSTLGHAR